MVYTAGAADVKLRFCGEKVRIYLNMYRSIYKTLEQLAHRAEQKQQCFLKQRKLSSGSSIKIIKEFCQPPEKPYSCYRNSNFQNYRTVFERFLEISPSVSWGWWVLDLQN